MVNPFVRIRKSIANLPDKKKYIEVITASLSIPVLLSVVLVNYLNIQDKRSGGTPTPIVTQAPQIITIIKEPVERNDTPAPTSATSPTPTQKDECIKEIGPISINSPEENESVSGNPLEIDIKYDQGDYCSVVWSYRINKGNWSDYIDDDIVIYNMDSGGKTLDLRVKSIVSNANETLTRTFMYQNTGSEPTPTLSPSPTGTE